MSSCVCICSTPACTSAWYFASNAVGAGVGFGVGVGTGAGGVDSESKESDFDGGAVCFIFMLIWIFIMVFADIFRRHDIHGGAKAGWILLIVILTRGRLGYQPGPKQS